MKTKNFIGEYQVSDQAVDEIMSYWKENKTSAVQGTISEVGKTLSSDNKHKKSLELSILPNELNNFKYTKELVDCANQYKKEYEYSDKVDSYTITEKTKIQYYDKGWGFYKWHFENNGNNHTLFRHLVFATYLNNVEDGGTQFLHQNYTVKAKKGKTIIFPAIWTHTHKGEITKNQEKYIITGWFNFIT
jgi:prolyl 4-hydroxylase